MKGYGRCGIHTTVPVNCQLGLDGAYKYGKCGTEDYADSRKDGAPRLNIPTQVLT